ncbi:hypothetical protein D9756_010980 [Leucocoprinus leucothites]|uniref:Ribosomal protein S8 n=1 Tax=Leucocoprinus leucothites TaxID=201217 RepID=A0A8H5CPB4_9AGAR|nr:hypothetical protein D9756_010980 [Leucoagaricus leucothites]
MVRISVLNDYLNNIINAERRGKRQVLSLYQRSWSSSLALCSAMVSSPFISTRSPISFLSSSERNNYDWRTRVFALRGSRFNPPINQSSSPLTNTARHRCSSPTRVHRRDYMPSPISPSPLIPFIFRFSSPICHTRVIMTDHSCIRTGYIGEFEILDDHRSGKIVIQLNGRLNKTGVISPRFNIQHTQIESWVNLLLPARGFGILILTTFSGILDHEEARRKNVGGKLLGYVY